MNETVYRQVYAIASDGPGIFYDPIEPNPLDEIERLKGELDSLVGDCERAHAERLSTLGENAHLRSLLADAYHLLISGVEGDSHILGLRDALVDRIRATLKGEPSLITDRTPTMYREDDYGITYTLQEPPEDGMVCYRNRWWVSHPTRGLVSWKGQPQCNANRSVPDRLLPLYPWAEVVFLETAFIREDHRWD